ncbi:MAG: rhodanese-like domain-containing protein [Christiangramia sp.]
MKVEQIYTGCLAHAAYYIENDKEAAIFDPLREVQPYLDRAKKDSAEIKYVFETHFHADFVSGHLDLKEKAGAEIVFGPLAEPDYKATIAKDGQIFEVGNYKVKVIHTPGHTMESTTYLLIDENDKEYGLITGDTLFIGDVGRPDLAQHVVADLTERKLAGHLYDSLRNKIMPLSDDLIIFPNHGAGSACGKNMSSETTDTLGHQKKVNYALQEMTKEEFIDALLEGLTAPPGYFPQNVLLNIKGYESFDKIMNRANQALSPEEFEELANTSGALILDTRNAEDFAKSFIPNSINIGLDGNFASWVGEMIPGVEHPILLVTNPGKEEEAITRLARVGYDHVLGYLKGGFDTWLQKGKEYDHIERISAKDFEKMYLIGKPTVIDIRKKSEFNSEHVRGAINIPLNEINKHLNEIPKDEFFLVYCAGGYRSMIAASILKQRGWETFADVRGGFTDITITNVPRSEFSLPGTIL